jgi:putative permease
MVNLISTWFKRHFSDPQVVILAVLLIVGTVVILMLGNLLAPVLASVVIAYLLEGLVSILQRVKIPRFVAVLLVFFGFIIFLLFLLLGLFPLVWQQLGQLFQQLPTMISWTQRELLRLPERYPDFISEKQLLEITNVLRSELTELGQAILSRSVASVRGFISILVYTFLMPLLVFFFLKDKVRLLQWVTQFLPDNRSLAAEVWREVDRKIGNYIRGKFWEILIFSVGLELPLCLCACHLYCNSVPGRKCPGPLALLGSGEHSPRCHHGVGADFRRNVGVLGGLFRDPASHLGTGGSENLGTTPEKRPR